MWFNQSVPIFSFPVCMYMYWFTTILSDHGYMLFIKELFVMVLVSDVPGGQPFSMSSLWEIMRWLLTYFQLLAWQKYWAKCEKILRKAIQSIRIVPQKFSALTLSCRPSSPLVDLLSWQNCKGGSCEHRDRPPLATNYCDIVMEGNDQSTYLKKCIATCKFAR